MKRPLSISAPAPAVLASAAGAPPSYGFESTTVGAGGLLRRHV